MNGNQNEKNSDAYNKPNFDDLEQILETIKNEQDIHFQARENTTGSIVLKYNDKNQVYFKERKYGISYSYQVDGKWNTDRIKTVSQLEESVNTYLSQSALFSKQQLVQPIQKLTQQVQHPPLESEVKQSSTPREQLIPEMFDYFPRTIIKDFTDVDIFERFMDKGKHVLLIGPTGSGKSTLARYYCAKNQKPYMRLSLNGGATVEDLVGLWTLKSDENLNQITVWSDGLLAQAMIHGWVIVIDEINAASADVLFKLNSVLDDERILILTEKAGEVINPHDDFRLVATCNPTELGYSGTQELNESLLDRFGGSTLYIDYNDKVERKILKKLPLSLEQVNNIQNFAEKIRNAYNQGEIMTPLSTRTLMNLGELYSEGMEDLIQYRFKQSEWDKISDNIDILLRPKETVKIDNNNQDDE